MSKYLNLERWFHGLLGAFIGGGSAGVIAGLTASAIAPATFNLGVKLGQTLELFATVFIIQGMVSAFLYLSKAPVPELDTEINETKITLTSTTTTPAVEPDNRVQPGGESGA
jgi:hypothetical protein